jgi:formate C-acetyltransferase
MTPWHEDDLAARILATEKSVTLLRLPVEAEDNDPLGRKKGEPLCDSLSAVHGKDTAGPTALLNSVTSLNLNRALGVPVLNFNINPDFKDEVLKALILGYMKQGGIQMQITCISREILEEAYRNPEDHKNLVVRVGGYSEYFYRLNDEIKRMIIERTIQKGV